MVMLFAVLNECRGGLPKSEVISRIRERNWFDIQLEDKQPYQSNKHGSKEARWITIIAWARKDAVERHLMHSGTRDNWDLNSAGLDAFSAISRAFHATQLDVRQCYLWSRIFKQHMDGCYTPGQPERTRPAWLYYGDWRQRILDSL
jgi:hypothetical protein